VDWISNLGPSFRFEISLFSPVAFGNSVSGLQRDMVALLLLFVLDENGREVLGPSLAFFFPSTLFFPLIAAAVVW